MPPIRKVAVFGASGTFGTPITAALLNAGFEVTIVTRAADGSSSSSSPPTTSKTFPAQVASVVEVDSYGDVAALAAALAGHDAAVSVLGPAALAHEAALVDAAAAAGLRRFVVNDFGWGQNPRCFPEMREVGARRHVAWDRARDRADADPAFTWTGVTIGNPIDWALRRFPRMGFNVAERTAAIYDSGTETFTGTTLEGIGQAVVGVLRHPEATANRFVKARSIQTCQNELLDAFQNQNNNNNNAPGQQQQPWTVTHDSVAGLRESSRQKRQAGVAGWILDLLVAQLYDEGEARCVVAPSRQDSDADLLGIREETAQEVAAKALGLAG
ncbi:NAD(P)-binding protein [Apiospora kogelbergensis]|uniref:NAD(P)-binding protein n=1 Tax=Apiospora kogelbergensis TaxID=1337665 RepID=A0AAW0Q3J1_9PEZI